MLRRIVWLIPILLMAGYAFWGLEWSDYQRGYNQAVRDAKQADQEMGWVVGAGGQILTKTLQKSLDSAKSRQVGSGLPQPPIQNGTFPNGTFPNGTFPNGAFPSGQQPGQTNQQARGPQGYLPPPAAVSTSAGPQGSGPQGSGPQGSGPQNQWQQGYRQALQDYLQQRSR